MSCRYISEEKLNESFYLSSSISQMKNPNENECLSSGRSTFSIAKRNRFQAKTYLLSLNLTLPYFMNNIRSSYTMPQEPHQAPDLSQHLNSITFSLSPFDTPWLSLSRSLLCTAHFHHTEKDTHYSKLEGPIVNPSGLSPPCGDCCVWFGELGLIDKECRTENSCKNS